MRLIIRAGNRAQWPIAYSGGYHPHPKVSFGPALPVGVAGDNEYFDVELSEEWSPEALATRLNENLHDGFRVLVAGSIHRSTPTIDALVDRFDYLIRFDADTLHGHIGGVQELETRLQQHFSNGGWMIERVVGKKRKRVDAASFVASSAFSASNGHTDWHLTLVSQDGRCIKPRELIESLFGDWPEGTVITRVRMGRLLEGRLVGPMEVPSG